MTGINILAEYTAGGMPVGAVVILSLLSLFGLIASILLTIDDSPGKAITFGFATGFAVVAISLGVFAEPEHTRYKVTISEDVKLVEFLEQYEILDTEGEIYTIREVIPDA
jgi:hypothetical protein